MQLPFLAPSIRPLFPNIFIFFLKLGLNTRSLAKNHIRVPNRLYFKILHLYSMCIYGSKKEPIPNFNILFWRRCQGLFNSFIRLNFGCLVRGEAIIKNSQYCLNPQKSPLSFYHGLHKQKVTHFIFFSYRPI